MHQHANATGWSALAIAAIADVAVNHALTVVSIVGLVVTAVCQVGHLVLRWRETNGAQGALKTKLFREWEKARDSNP